MEENNKTNGTEQATEQTEQTTQQTQAQGTEQANPNPTPQPQQEPKKGVAERVLGGVGKLLDKAVPIVIGAVVVGGCAYVKGRHDGKEATLRKAARKVEVPPVHEPIQQAEQATEQTTEQRRPIGFDAYGNPIG